MLNLVRLLSSAWSAWRQPRLDVRHNSSLSFLVLPGDIDPFLHVTNARYLDFMNIARLDLLVRTGLFQAAWRMKVPMLVGAIEVHYRRPLPPFRRFTLVSRLLAWDHKWFMWEHTFVSEGRVAAYGIAKVTFGGREARISPAELLRAAGQEPESPPAPEWVGPWLGTSRPGDPVSAAVRNLPPIGPRSGG